VGSGRYGFGQRDDARRHGNTDGIHIFNHSDDNQFFHPYDSSGGATVTITGTGLTGATALVLAEPQQRALTLLRRQITAL